MRYHQPFDQPLIPLAPYVNGNPGAGVPGSIPDAGAIEYPQREITNAISLSGLTPDDGDLFQLTRVIRGGQLDFDATDIGTADAILCQVALAHTSIKAGLPFSFVKGPAANTGNVLPTLTITDQQGNNGLTGQIVKATGTALGKGDLPANALITVRAVSAGVFAVVSLLTISDVLALIASNAGQAVIQVAPRGGQVFLSSGTWTCPNNVTRVLAEGWGGGAGGGGSATNSGAASGGGAGGYFWGVYTVTPGTTYNIVIGAGGGAGTTAGTGGGNGGATGFDSFAAAAGGGGGLGANGNVASTGGAGGTASGGLINLTGSAGGNGLIIGSAYLGGQGGPSRFGGGYSALGLVGQQGVPFGGGGGGGGGANNGANGAGGALKLVY